MSPDVEKWPTDEEAAAALGTSSKTIHRYAEKGWIEIRKRSRRGKKPENVCNPLDIEKLKPPPHVMPEDQFDRIDKLNLTSTEGKLTFAYLFKEMLNRTAPQLPPPPPEPWITLAEAGAQYRFSRSFIRRQIKAGKIEAHRAGHRGALLIRRASLESF